VNNLKSRRQVGDWVDVRSLFGGEYWSGQIVKVDYGLFRSRYLIRYKVWDLDFDIHYEKMKWFSERRLI
jgi:hypothetical protein